MFDLLLNPVQAEKKPWDLFLFAIVFTGVALWVSATFFSHFVGFGSAVILTLLFFPLLFKAFSREEDEDIHLRSEADRFYAHRNIVILFVFIFLGSLSGYFLAYNFLPPELRDTFFVDQLSTIDASSPLTGNAVNPELALVSILQANFFLLFLCLTLSLLFGFGGLLLMTWNSSVLGVAIALFIQRSFMTPTVSVPLGFLRYLLHGLPEVVSFFLASLGGSILFLALFKHDLHGDHGKKILQDGITLTVASVALLFLSALIEVFLTPLFF